jgi:hypothetical protein
MATGKARRSAARNLGRGGSGLAQGEGTEPARALYVAFFEHDPLRSTPIAFIEGGKLLIWNGIGYSEQVSESDRGGALRRWVISAIGEAAVQHSGTDPVAYGRGVAKASEALERGYAGSRRLQHRNRRKGKQRP